MNNCDTTYTGTTNQSPWHPEQPLLGTLCKQFTGCPADYPVVFCTTQGLGKGDQNQRATLAFTLFFDQMNAAQAR
jgi:hypothetical protein